VISPEETPWLEELLLSKMMKNYTSATKTQHYGIQHNNAQRKGFIFDAQPIQ
jgi:hypothetical protein